MITEIAAMNPPEWLLAVNPETIHTNPFPLTQILTDSLYYPSSGFDGRPVAYLAGNIFSFIYVDYGRNDQELDHALNFRGFKGYELIARRELSQNDLAPNGWQPTYPTRIDGRMPRTQNIKPYSHWFIFQRMPDFTENHGPECFSLVYLCADGAAAFQALYHTNRIAPKAVAIIRPGHGFGGNWTDFTDEDLIFGRSVLQNPGGKPDFLLFDATKSYWKEYDTSVKKISSSYDVIGIWKRSI